MMDRKHIYIWVVFVATGFFATVGVWHLLPYYGYGKDLLSDTSRFEKWEQRIKDIGGRAALEEFAQSAEKESPERAHELAHVFGGALYLAEGLTGLIVCDARFNYGCFHEFLGRAIADHGLAVVTDLNEACIASLGEVAHFCQHGLGHGVLAYFGYRNSELDDALATCDELEANDPVGGCNGGVFMEYNIRTMLGEEGAVRTSQDLFAPCNRLSNRHLLACYYWQPQWWLASRLPQAPKEEEELFAYIGTLCTEMAHGTARLEYACYEGIGNILRGWNGGTRKYMCDAVSSNKYLQEKCWSAIQ